MYKVFFQSFSKPTTVLLSKSYFWVSVGGFEMASRSFTNKSINLVYLWNLWKIAQAKIFTNKNSKHPIAYCPMCLIPMLGIMYKRILNKIDLHIL